MELKINFIAVFDYNIFLHTYKYVYGAYVAIKDSFLICFVTAALEMPDFSSPVADSEARRGPVNCTLNHRKRACDSCYVCIGCAPTLTCSSRENHPKKYSREGM